MRWLRKLSTAIDESLCGWREALSTMTKLAAIELPPGVAHGANICTISSSGCRVLRPRSSPHVVSAIKDSQGQMPPRDAETAWTPVIQKVFRALSRAVAVAFLLLPGTWHDVLDTDPSRARAGRPTGSSSYCRDGTNEWMTYTVVDSLLRTDDTVGVGPMRAAHWVVRGRALVSDH